jgi:ribosomal protein L37AE/L43A
MKFETNINLSEKTRWEISQHSLTVCEDIPTNGGFLGAEGKRWRCDRCGWSLIVDPYTVRTDMSKSGWIWLEVEPNLFKSYNHSPDLPNCKDWAMRRALK